MKMRSVGVVSLAFIVATIGSISSTGRAATAVTPTVAATVDSDGDGVPDLFNGNSFDNAPGVLNPSQMDTDGDQYGDVIDPDPNTPGPVVDIGFAIGGTYTVAPGAGVTIDFTTTNSPPGDFGHINLMMDGGATANAVAFQSLAAPGGSFYIPPGVFTLPGLWDLNSPGTYQVEAWGLAPGEIAGYKGGAATVIVTPEPASAALLLACSALIARRRRS